jgi:hypothetical protein
MIIECKTFNNLCICHVSIPFEDIKTYMNMRHVISRDMFLDITKPGKHEGIFIISDIDPHKDSEYKHQFIVSIDTKLKLEDTDLDQIALVINLEDLEKSKYGFTINISDGQIVNYDETAKINW